jgi:hypothetical protein
MRGDLQAPEPRGLVTPVAAARPASQERDRPRETRGRSENAPPRRAPKGVAQRLTVSVFLSVVALPLFGWNRTATVTLTVPRR